MGALRRHEMNFATTSALRSPRVPNGSAVPGRLYKALLLLLLACLLMQGTAIQAHVHLVRPVAASAGTPSAAKVPGREMSAAACSLCVEAAMAGHYLQPSATALPAPAPQVLGVDPQSLAEFRLLSRAHGWLSRAPPQ